MHLCKRQSYKYNLVNCVKCHISTGKRVNFVKLKYNIFIYLLITRKKKEKKRKKKDIII